MTDFRPNGMVTLTTDFGDQDGYVGAMKGVILSIDAGINMVDVAHGIAPQNIVHATGVVAESAPFFPVGTVHLVVVDPGVGSARAAVVAHIGAHLYVGADNGLFPAVAQRLRAAITAWHIEPNGPGSAWLPERISHTFHGRDLFAPVAAALATGQLSVERLGTTSKLLVPETRGPVIADGHVTGRIVTFDRFGNAITNIAEEHLTGAGPFTVQVGETDRLPLVETYASVDQGSIAALVGSSGRVEIAVREGSARRALGLKVGLTVVAVPNIPEP